MSPRFFSLRGFTKTFQTLALIWLFAAGHLALLFARTQGLWFEGFYGISTGFLVSVAIVISVFCQSIYFLNKTTLLMLLLFLIALLIPIVFSSKVIAGEIHGIRKILFLLPYVIVPSIWGSLFRKEVVNERSFIKICFLLLVLGNLLIFRHYSELAVSYFRAGEESNPIALSYAFADLWIFVAAFCLLRGKRALFAICSILAIANIFLFATRQSLVYLLFVLLTFGVIHLQPFSLYNSPRFKINLSIKKLKALSLVLLLSTIFVASLVTLSSTLDKGDVINKSFDTTLARWSVFVESGYSDTVRSQLLRETFLSWQDSPLLGNFAYEEPGFYAHHMFIDLLAQYGLLGTIFYLFLIGIALRNAWKTKKNNLLDSIFLLMFVGLMVVAVFVATLTTSPTFHFLLFYWVSRPFKPELA